MKLYVENGEVFFDFSDINMSTQVDSSDFLKAANVRHFLSNTVCSWDNTGNPQILKMTASAYWETEYYYAHEYERNLLNCLSNARICDIEISTDVEEFCILLAKYCKKIYETERALEKERTAKEKWQRLCENGCGCCNNKSRWNDDIVCAASGDLLNEKLLLGIVNGSHTLFNRVAFPSANCPYKVVDNGG